MLVLEIGLWVFPLLTMVLMLDGMPTGPLFVLTVLVRIAVGVAFGWQTTAEGDIELFGIGRSALSRRALRSVRGIMLWRLLGRDVRVLCLVGGGVGPYPRLTMIADSDRRLVQQVLANGGKILRTSLFEGRVETVSERSVRETEGFFDEL